MHITVGPIHCISPVSTTKAWTVTSADFSNSEQVVEMDADWLPNCLDS